MASNGLKKTRKSPRRTKGRTAGKIRHKAGRVATSHAAVPGSQRPAPEGATRIADLAPHAQVEVTLTLRGPELPGIASAHLEQLPTKTIETSISASQSDADKVTHCLEAYGLRIEEVSLLTRSIRVSGTAEAMEAAFHPGLGLYENSDQGVFRDRENDYQVPKELTGIVTAVLGFGQRRVARRRATSALKKTATSFAPFSPTDIEQYYGFPASTAKGQKIGIAEFGGGYFASDLQAYCAKFGRTMPTVNAISINAPAYTLQQIQHLPPAQRKDELDASVEVMMDVQIIAGLCSDAQIDVYFATFDQKGWVDLLNRAVTDRPVALSISWGLAEEDPAWSPAARDAINQALHTAALLGITICVASGDDGSGDQEDDGRAHVDFPGSSPFVLCVGGTMITGGGATALEQVWWEAPGRRTPTGGGATGGGVSTLFPRPAWQDQRIASLNPKSIDGRIVPDVTALAGDPGYDLIFLGGDQPNGGTSASAPLWAALVARLNELLPTAKQTRCMVPLLYQKTPSGKSLGGVACRDITLGNNASHPKPGVGYQAQSGYDAVSGWGAPIGTALLAGL